MRAVFFVAGLLVAWLVTLPRYCGINRWDIGEEIPGTEHITPGQSLMLAEWASENRNLRFADFSGGLDLSTSRFSRSWLEHATFADANLTWAHFRETHISDAILSRTNLTSADLDGDILTNSDFSDAIVRRAAFGNSNLTAQQLYSTASYEEKDLTGIDFFGHDLSGWDFHGQNLTGASLIDFPRISDLTQADLSEANLTAAYIAFVPLTNADFSRAIVKQTNFSSFPQNNGVAGLTKAQLYATASYETRDPLGIGLSGNDLTGWNLNRQNLAYANFYQANLSEVSFTGDDLRNANLQESVNIEMAIFDAGTVYNQWTAFPVSFDPIEAGLSLRATLDGDFDNDGLLALSDVDLLHDAANEVACNRIRPSRIGGATACNCSDDESAAAGHQTSRSKKMGLPQRSCFPGHLAALSCKIY